MNILEQTNWIYFTLKQLIIAMRVYQFLKQLHCLSSFQKALLY